MTKTNNTTSRALDRPFIVELQRRHNLRRAFDSVRRGKNPRRRDIGVLRTLAHGLPAAA